MKTKAVSLLSPNGTIPTKGGAKIPTGKINMHHLDGSQNRSGVKNNKTKKVGK